MKKAGVSRKKWSVYMKKASVSRKKTSVSMGFRVERVPAEEVVMSGHGTHDCPGRADLFSFLSARNRNLSARKPKHSTPESLHGAHVRPGCGHGTHDCPGRAVLGQRVRSNDAPFRSQIHRFVPEKQHVNLRVAL